MFCTKAIQFSWVIWSVYTNKKREVEYDCLFVQNVCPNRTRKAPVKEIEGPENRESLMNSKYGISCKKHHSKIYPKEKGGIINCPPKFVPPKIAIHFGLNPQDHYTSWVIQVNY